MNLGSNDGLVAYKDGARLAFEHCTMPVLQEVAGVSSSDSLKAAAGFNDQPPPLPPPFPPCPPVPNGGRGMELLLSRLGESKYTCMLQSLLPRLL